MDGVTGGKGELHLISRHKDVLLVKGSTGPTLQTVEALITFHYLEGKVFILLSLLLVTYMTFT